MESVFPLESKREHNTDIVTAYITAEPGIVYVTHCLRGSHRFDAFWHFYGRKRGPFWSLKETVDGIQFIFIAFTHSVPRTESYRCHI